MASGLDELLSGESSQIEYKVARPKDAKKYLKTVVAFANGRGGTLVFGVDDKTREVRGVPPEDVFEEMDAISNAIDDACVPTIIPSMSIQEAHGKSVIVVKVDPGRQLPYYLKSEGLQQGVYVRSGATSRQADFDYVQAMMLESVPRGFDRLPNKDAVVTEDSVRTLCARMKSIALRRAKNDVERAEVKDVTVNNLVTWGVLERKDGRLQANNAYAMLTGETEEPSWRVQCAVFRGRGRSLFLDRREYAGSVIDQVEEAYQYVLSKINVGANFDGVVRQDVYEIPLWPIRELITNAVLHRSYTSSGCVQVCLFDDRLEVTSPGGLVRNITLEEALTGRSEPRSKALARAFRYMKFIENWGTGIGRVVDEVTGFGLRKPEFLVSDSQFRVNVYRLSDAEFEERLRGNPAETLPDEGSRGQKAAGDESAAAGGSGGDGPTASDGRTAIERRLAAIGGDRAAIERRLAALGGDRAATVLAEAEANDFITTSDVAELLDLRPTRAREIVSELVDMGLLARSGTGRYTRYFLPKEA